MLYHPEHFEPLTETPWDPGRVRAAIGRIVEDSERGFRGMDRLWPMPPRQPTTEADPMKNVYEGASGMVLALDVLRRRGLAQTRLDLAGIAVRAVELFRAEPDYEHTTLQTPTPRDSGLLAGEAGILLLAWRLAPDADLADALLTRVGENVGCDSEELMWGTPGTLVAAATMLEWTGDERWRDAWHESARALLARRDDDGLWTQRLYGKESRVLGSVHGAAGIVQALTRLLEPEAQATLERETAGMFARTAVVEDGRANWPHAVSEPPGFLRWCSGAPGILACAAGYLDEELLLAAALLVAEAGPHGRSSGPVFCCGTAGNAYALLKVFERTGDERWLEHARRFVVHALEQVDRERAIGAPPWHVLWQGDTGVALVAADCLDGRAAFPLLDGW